MTLGLESHGEISGSGNRVPKFRIPRFPRATIPRPRLIARLDRLAAVTILEAPAGYGKTALVGLWARRQQDAGAVVLWVSAVEGDYPMAEIAVEIELSREAPVERDPVVPVTPVRYGPSSAPRAGMRDSREDFYRAPAGHTRPSTFVQPSDAVRRVIVILNDGQSIEDPSILNNICSVIQTDMEVHFVVNSRRRHPLSRTAHQAGIEVDVISRRDLELTPEELVDIAHTWRHDISIDRANELHGAIGGWPTVAKLVLDDVAPFTRQIRIDGAREFLQDAFRNTADGTRLEAIAQRLALSEVVSRETVELVLAGFGAETPEHVDEYPEVILAQLELGGLLREIDGLGLATSYAFPWLIRQMLAVGFEAGSPVEATATHRLLGRHFASGNEADCGKALVHAHISDDWPLLAELYLRYGPSLTVDFPDETMDAYSTIPESVLADFAILAVPRAMARGLINDPQDEERSLMINAYLQAGEQPIGKIDPGDSVDELTARVVGSIITKRSTGHIFDALRLAERLDAHLADRNARGQTKPVPVQLVWFILHWSATLLLAGQIPRAIELSTRAFDSSSERATEHMAGAAAAHLVLIHTLRGEQLHAAQWRRRHERTNRDEHWMNYLVSLPVEIAAVLEAVSTLDRRAARDALERIGDAAQPVELWAFIAFAAAQYALLFGEPVVMLTQLGQLAELHSDILREPGVARQILNRCRADLLLALGELNQVQRLLTAAEVGEIWACVPNARLLLIAGNPVEAKDIAAAGMWRSETNLYDRIDLQIIIARSELALDQQDLAGKSFLRAHELAVAVATLRPYVLIPPNELEILCALGGIAFSAADAELIAAVRPVYPDHAVLTVLSPRETIVLGELAREVSLAEVAKKLDVSINTIKKQTVSLYAKLGVRDRPSAIARARWLGLVP